MAKKRKAARKPVTHKPARRRRASSPDATINTLVILVVIVIVLGGLYLYAHNKKQAALWPSLMQTVETLIAPQPATLTTAPQPTAIASAPQPTAAIPPETTGSVQAIEPARPVSAIAAPESAGNI
jgi:hypothetical protein